MNPNNSKPALMEVEEVETKEGSKAEKNTAKAEASKAKPEAEATAKEVKEEASIPTAGADDDMAKVQELLFGNQLRAVNQKIMLVHKDFKQSMSDLDRKIEQQLADQESMIKKELASVVDQLRAETKARENAIENSGMELRKSGNNLQDRINAMEKTHSAAKTAMDEQLAQSVRDLERQMQEVRSELQRQLDGARNTLDDNKVDRAALSELLGGIAQQISSIDKIPTVTQRSDAANSSEDSPKSGAA